MLKKSIMTDVSDIYSLDLQIIPYLSKEQLIKYRALTKELIKKYIQYPRKIVFMKRNRDAVKKKIITDYLTRALLFVPTGMLKNSIIEYLTEVKKTDIPDNRCQECHSDNFQVSDETGNLVCMNCGLESPDISEVAYHDSCDNMTVTRKPIYQRSKQFKELLNSFQGKLSNQIDPDIIQRMKQWFETNGINPTKCTRNNIYTCLSESGFPDLYGSVQYLYSYFSGLPLPNITRYEGTLLCDYEQIQQAFNTLSTEEKQDRNNILKSTVVLKALMIKNRIPFESDAFSDLKGDDRNRQYEAILKLLFKKLKWKTK
jgi:hypothetical protein